MQWVISAPVAFKVIYKKKGKKKEKTSFLNLKDSSNKISVTPEFISASCI